jgi:iron complex outermembrane receptor protein
LSSKNFLSLLLLNSLVFAESLDNLLEEYKISSDLSNKTIDEKIGHLTVYTQQQLQQMQYKKLSDVLKELTILNQNNNVYGVKNLGISGFNSPISTSIRIFINDHEVSSVHTLSPFLVWDSLPLDFINHIEIYTGDSSFSLGNEPGTTFIRVYTKSPSKENGNQLTLSSSTNNERYFGASHSEVLENRWSFLVYAGNQTVDDSKQSINGTLHNDSTRKYLYSTIQKDNAKIDLAYAELYKDNYIGLSRDSIPDNGNIESKDYFISYSNTYLRDDSLKTVFSIDINERNYLEKNAQGIILLPVIDQSSITNMFNTIPTYYDEKLRFEKYDTYISKSFSQKTNEVILASSVKHKKYILDDRTTISNTQTLEDEKFSEFDTETLYSFMIEDKYKINEYLHLIGDAKFDKYQRNADLDDSIEHLYKLGLIFVPNDNLGFKLFASQSYMSPTFYYVDMASPSVDNLESQKINYYSLENAYTYNSNKFDLVFTNIQVDDMIYLSSNGFKNSDKEVEGNSVMFKYTYDFDLKNQFMFNVYTLNSNQVESNSSSGGTVKYMGSYDQFDYFTSLLYKEGYTFSNFEVKDGFDVNAGTTYNYNKNISFSLKGENLLNKSIKSLYADKTTSPFTYFSLRDDERAFLLSMKWLF